MQKRRKLQRPKMPVAVTLQRRFFVRLDAPPPPADGTAEEEDGPKWGMITRAGTYAGYGGGERPFEFTAETFTQIVNNFRANPSYSKPDGESYGAEPVIAWDFHHASEAPANTGNIGQVGAPAQGWILDVEVRNDEQGIPTLWALTDWLEPARSYIKEGRYRWASVVVVFDAVDGVSGANVGAVLLSVALTNQPFVEGLEPLAADKNAAAGGGDAGKNVRRLQYFYFDAAQSPEQALCSLRQLFGLASTSGVRDVLGEVMKLQEWDATGEIPLGVEVDDLVAGMRRILNLRALALPAEVFAECSKLLGALLASEPDGDEPPASQPATPAPMPVATSRNQGETMSLLIKLGKKLGVQATDEAIEAAVLELVDGMAKIAVALGKPEKAALSVVLEAGADAASVRAKLGALLKALGIDNADESVDKVANLMQSAAKLEEVMPELKSLREAAAKDEETKGDEEVDQVMNAKGYPDELRDAVVLERKTDKTKWQAKHKEVLASKPAPAAAATPAGGSKAVLRASIATAPGGAERQITKNPDGSYRLSEAGRANAGEQNGRKPGATVINLTAYKGANRTQRMVEHVQATNKDLSYDQAFSKAHELLHSENVEVEDVG